MWKLKKMSLWIKQTGLSGEYQSLVVMRMSDESVDRDADKEKTGDKIWNNGRGR